MKAGFKSNSDPFDQSPRSSIWHMNVAVSPTGRRMDSCTAYLTPALAGSCGENLNLLQGVTVTRVLLDESKLPHATGVEYVHSTDTAFKKKIMLNASQEVILSAGPYGSPKLLQLSGIGLEKHLKKLDWRRE